MAVLELTNFSDSGLLNDAWFVQGHVVTSSGTGVIDPFVRLQADGSEEGYNTDFRPVQFDENTDANFTDGLLLADVPVVQSIDTDGDGKADTFGPFYEFRLDLNQTNSDTFISLDSLALYLTRPTGVDDKGNLINTVTGFNSPYAGGTGFGKDGELVYSLDGHSGDFNTALNDPANYLILNVIESGSGDADYFFYVPVSAFSDALNRIATDGDAGTDPADYIWVNLYSSFGNIAEYTLTKDVDLDGDGQFNKTGEATKGDTVSTASNDGFEEWNIVPQVSLEWEKRDEAGNLQGGATFTVTPDPTDGVGVLTVVDNGANDADPDAGQIKIVNILPGSYTVTETVPQTGWFLDDDTTRAVTIGKSDVHVVIGTTGVDDVGNTDESDFHNRLGSIAWEKRTEGGALQGGATFEISLDPKDGLGVLTVVDNGANDADPVAGQILVTNALAGTYTVTETIAPTGWALDDDPTRVVTVSASDINAVIGVQGADNLGNTDESDFHNRLGSIAWEKRDEVGNYVTGATFEINLDPKDGSGILTVVDNGANDADPTGGKILVTNALLGTYTVTETVPPAGYGLDNDPTRIVTVSSSELTAVIGVQGSDDAGDTDESDFHDPKGSIAWEKRDEAGNYVGGATFEISLDPKDGVGVLTVVDNGANDADATLGKILVTDALVGTYTITETIAPAGYALDDDPTRIVTVSLNELTAVVGVENTDDAGNTDESDFHNRLGSIAWEKRDEAGNYQTGATFEINLDPKDGSGILTVVDNGANDADPTGGKILVTNALLGTYTVTETIAPAGYALDDDPTRIVTVSSSELTAVIGVQDTDDAGNTDESDFHNRLGSIAWEKRDEAGNYQTGATFEINLDPKDGVGVLTVVDNGANDADPTGGKILVTNALLGTYTVTETVGISGYALDDDVTRVVTVSAGELTAVIGTQGSDDAGNTDESDFHNRLGSIAWEKRDTNGDYQTGATFEINLDPKDGSGILTVVDNGANDADPTGGKILVTNALLGTYTVTETIAPAGTFLDPDPTRVVTVSESDLNAVIGVQGSDDAGSTDESDFHNLLPGAISGYKWADTANFGVWDGGELGIPNWTIRLYVDANDNDQIDAGETFVEDITDANGFFEFNNLVPGTSYIVAEVLQPNYTQTFPGTTQVDSTDPLIGDYGYEIDMTSGLIVAGDSGQAETPNFGNHLQGTQVRTPGFWQNPNNGAQFWDGLSDLNNPKAGTPGFPTEDLIILGNTLGDPNTSVDDYILIGDWSGDGIENFGEDTIQVLRSEALKFVSADAKQVQDGRWMLMRDLTATWLNKLAGSDTSVVHAYIDEAIDWMNQTTPGLADGVLYTSELTSLTAVKQNSAPWKEGFDLAAPAGVSSNVADPDILPGSLLHQYLDHYNNTGFIF